MGPRWKGKDAEAKAHAEPMSKIVSELCSSLILSNARGLLAGHSVLLALATEQVELFTRACFGKHNITAEKDKQWFQLGMEEAFYLCHALKCLKIVGGDNCVKDDMELWQYMKPKKANFPEFYKAYSHLRMKNWVVMPGSKYGVHFVAYQHHPSLVHSEYAVLVLSGDSEMNARLREWSDVYCTVRLCGTVAKTLLVLNIYKNGAGDVSPSCLERYTVEEQTITRWIPEQSREDGRTIRNGFMKHVVAISRLQTNVDQREMEETQDTGLKFHNETLNTLLSNSDTNKGIESLSNESRSGLNTPQELGLRNNNILFDTTSFISARNDASASYTPTENASATIHEG